MIVTGPAALKRVVFAAIGFIAAAPASAQDWDWSVTPYLWAAGVDGAVAIGPLSVEGSVHFGDLVDFFSGAALVRIEGQTEQHGVFADITYLGLDEGASSADAGLVELKLDSLIVEGAYLYKISDRNAIELGARFWNFEATMIPILSDAVSRRSSWTDGFVGFRSESEIGANWSWLVRVNFGAGGSDLAAGLGIDFRRRLASGNSIVVGYRGLDVEYETGFGLTELILDTSVHGLTIGFTFD